LGSRIFQWLTDAQGSEFKSVDNFLNRLVARQNPQAPVPSGFMKPRDHILPDRETSIYYGIDGKRKAAICFLSEVLTLSQPITLLLFSDEPTEWMTSDPAFTSKWASLMFEVLSKGNRIRIIHTVSRDLDEMLNAISQWMPLYMTGLIEPYYYPKKRDGIFKRTLFIAPGTAAIISTSVGGMIHEAANFLIRGARAAAAIEQEFNHYFKLCNPLMRIFTAASQNAYTDTLYEFEKERAEAIIKTESLSLLTMPENVVSSIMARFGPSRFDLLAHLQKRIELFEENVKERCFTEIIRLPAPQDVKNGRVAVAFSDILYGGTVYYSASEYIQHLKNIVSLLKVHSNFHVCLTKEFDTRYIVYAKEDIGAIVAKTSTPPVILAINEENMTAAFWDFLKSFPEEKAYINPNNRKMIQSLSDYIKRF
jgi:hypothetical protein